MAQSDFIRINEAVKVYDKTRQTFYNYINKQHISTKKINNKLFLNVADIEKTLSEYADADIDSSSTHEKAQTSTENIAKKIITSPTTHPLPEQHRTHIDALSDTISTTITPPRYTEDPSTTVTYEQMNDILTRMDIMEDVLHDLEEHLQELPESLLSTQVTQADQLKELIFRLQGSITQDSTAYYHNLTQLVQISFKHLHETIDHQHQEAVTLTQQTTAQISLKKLRFRIYYLVFVCTNIGILIWIFALT